MFLSPVQLHDFYWSIFSLSTSALNIDLTLWISTGGSILRYLEKLGCLWNKFHYSLRNGAKGAETASWSWGPCQQPPATICGDIKSEPRASLVAQWLGICLPMQGTRVRALVWEDPTCRGATRPVSHNYWTCASGACAPQQERPRQWEARAPRWRLAPARRN